MSQVVKRRVVIVDSFADSAVALQLLLELEGYDVRTFLSAADAVQEIVRYRPHVVFLELGLADGPSGLDLARALRRHPELRHLLIAAVTSYVLERDKAAAYAAGIDCFFAKPIDIKEVAETVRTLDCERLVA